ncbi:MAG: sodium-dependent transporter [Candidatus Riflebacteria bacterium]|nr:sodium-dependent transporter [Candidatus Riflebacteria bacterium]
MDSSGPEKREHWGSKLGFILAAAGSAVGLGNIWKFPYITYENGGGAFVLLYLVCILCVGFPIMIAEFVLGKVSEKDAVGTFGVFRPDKKIFKFIGIIGVFTGFIILSYYSVVAGWTLEYTLKSLTCNEFIVEKVDYNSPELKKAIFNKHGVYDAAAKADILKNAGFTDDKTEENWKAFLDSNDTAHAAARLSIFDEVIQKAKTDLGEQKFEESALMISRQQKASEVFTNHLAKGTPMLLWHAVFMLLTGLIVFGGISGGIEKASRILMPLLFLLLGGLMIYSLTLSGGTEAIKFLFNADFAKLNRHSILEALGHAFFTLSLGMGAMITYGSYLKKEDGVVSSAITVSILDTLIALMACLTLYPILFTFNTEVSGGAGLLFITLPALLANTIGGSIILSIFFVLVAFAALSSTISLLEVVVTYTDDEFGWKRHTSTIVNSFVIFLVGVPSALCFGGNKFFTELTLLSKGDTKLNWFDSFDYLASNWLLPIGGLLIALFIGWMIKDQAKTNQIKEELGSGFYPVWNFLIKFVAPICVAVVIANKIGLIE